MDYKASFFVLKKIKYLEADLIIHALSSNGEKFSFLARGALKSKKRFGGGVLEPTHQALFTYQKPHNGGSLHLLKDAQIIHDFAPIRRSYETLEFALQVIGCIEKVSQEGDSNSEILYNLLGHTMKAIETTQHLEILKTQFYLKFMMQQGVITLEPWMGPFLKTQIQKHEDLAGREELMRGKLTPLESRVREYITTATAH
ncbi:MAG: DNA repair protein RecO [Bdellovibrionota bacterium]